MTDTPENRKRIARELRRGDQSSVYLRDWSDAMIEEFRAELERRVKRRVVVWRHRSHPESVTFNAGPKPKRE